jgi:DNA invertase Pin-like site-specific DNA recombinase
MRGGSSWPARCLLTAGRFDFTKHSTFVEWFVINGNRVMGTPNTGNFVAYYRVSTERQGRSGLGLEAQKAAVRDYLNGGNWKIVAEFVEVESGKRSDRPQLAAALAACALRGAKLIIAKLDRLARNVAFVSNLMEAGVDFVAVDFPTANRLTVHILAAVAEHEAKMISERTKAALAAAKARGQKLGGYRGIPLTPEARQAGCERRTAIADKRAAALAPTIAELRASGAATLQAIADGLNRSGIPTTSGRGEWQPVQVSRVLARLR